MDELINVMQDALQVFLIAVVPAVAGYLAILAKAQFDLMKANLEEKKPSLFNAIRVAVGLAVKAAEQLGAAGYIEDKKQYAFEIAQEFLSDQGWDEISVEIIEAAIESAVLAKFNSGDAKIDAYDL